MKNLVLKTFKLQLTALRVVGMYPPLKYKKIYKIYTYFIYFVFMIPEPVCGGMHLLHQKSFDITKIANNAFIVCEMFCYCFKMLPFIINAEGVRKCLYIMESPIFSAYTEKQSPIINEFSKISKRLYQVYAGFCLISYVLWIMKPMSFEERILPLDIWLPYTDPLSNTKVYTASYIMLCLGNLNGCLASGVVDPLMASLAYFAACQVQILKDNLQNIAENIEKDVDSNTEEHQEEIRLSVIYSRIKICVEHYEAVVNYIKHMEDTFTLTVFSQCFASVVVICLNILYLTVVEPFTEGFVAMVFFFSCMLAEVFLYCYYGTILFEESNTINDAIYMSPWYDFDMKAKRALIILMERSKRPITITAGKILDLSLVTFSTIIRRSYSLLAVLKNYQ